MFNVGLISMTSFILSFAIFTNVNATPIGLEIYGTGAPPSTVGGYSMTAFDLDPRANGVLVNSVASPIDGIVEFEDANGNSLQLRHETATSWQNGNLWSHGYTGDVYVAPLPEINWVELILPSNTQAFSFGVGASFSGVGWIEAYDEKGNTYFENFTVSPGSAKGFGFYTDTTECSQLTKIIVEPVEWAVGEFAISQGECGGSTVPEPNILFLYMLGLMGFCYSKKAFLG